MIKYINDAREEILEKDAFRNIIFQELLAGDSLETQRQKSRDNAVAAIACELDEIRKLLKPREEFEMADSSGEQGEADEILAEEKKSDDPVEYQRIIHRFQCDCGRYLDPFDESDCKDLAAMQRLVRLNGPQCGIKIEFDMKTLESVVYTAVDGGYWGEIGRGKTVQEAILNLKVEE